MRHHVLLRVGIILLQTITACAALAACGASSPVSSDVSATDNPDAGRASAAIRSGDGGAAAALESLEVAPLTLEPAFSPSTYDYFVRCAAGTNALTVTMTAAAGSTVALVQPTTSAASQSQTANLQLIENQAIVIQTTSGPAGQPYWIRCLPHDFPTITAVPHPDAGAPSPGFYLVGNTVYTASSEAPYAVVVDGNGTPVWYRRSPTSGGVLNVDMLLPGTISFTPFVDYTFGPVGDGEYELDQLSPWQTTYANTVGIPLDHHELRILPNGDFIMLSDLITTGVDLTGLQSFGANSSIVNCVIQEVDGIGNVQWQWMATDHFDPVQDSTWPQVVTAGGQNVVDPFHCNSVDVDVDGNLLVSARHMDSVFLVSKASGSLVWKMGGATYNKDGAPYIQVEGDTETAFYRQHDARFQPGAQISMFDDHTGEPGVARGVVYSIDFASDVATVVWAYAGSATSTAMGSFRLQPDGERVIGWGLPSAGNLVLSDLDSSGNDLLDLEFTAPDVSYRAVKMPRSSLDVNLLRGAVGLP